MRKGLTPIIAIVLLLMITVGVAGSAFYWITTLQSRSQGAINTKTTQTIDGAKNLKIISAKCSGEWVNVTIINGDNIINEGKSALTLTYSNKVITTSLKQLNYSLNNNEIITINYSITSITPNKSYGVKITLPGGIEGTTTCLAN